MPRFPHDYVDAEAKKIIELSLRQEELEKEIRELKVAITQKQQKGEDSWE